MPRRGDTGSAVELTAYTGSHIPAVLAARERDQAWLAREMRVSPSTVLRAIRKGRFTRDFVRRACAALEMPEGAL